MNEPEYPYRECKNCDGVICCKNLIIEEFTGRPKLPDDCIHKKEREVEIQKHYENV